MNRDLSQLQAVTDAETMLNLLKDWTAKSNNPDLEVFKNCVLRTTFYVNNLEMQLQTVDRLIDEARVEVHTERLRANHAEESMIALQEEVDRLKSSLNAFGL